MQQSRWRYSWIHMSGPRSGRRTFQRIIMDMETIICLTGHSVEGVVHHQATFSVSKDHDLNTRQSTCKYSYFIQCFHETQINRKRNKSKDMWVTKLVFLNWTVSQPHKSNFLSFSTLSYILIMLSFETHMNK